MNPQLLFKFFVYLVISLLPHITASAKINDVTKAILDLNQFEANVGTANTPSPPPVNTLEKSLHSSIVNLEGIPSAMVNNCVNVITGDYSEMQEDLVLPGPQPIIIRRGYSSAADNKGYYLFSHGWNLNHQGYMYIAEEKEPAYEGSTEIVGTGNYSAETEEGYGVELLYEGSPTKGFKLDSSIRSKNLTNCGSGEISGRTNLCNTRILKHDKSSYHMTLGSGLVRVFSTKCNSSYHFHLREERYPSGNSLSFNYGDQNTQFKKITAKNALGDILGYVEFDQKDPKKPVNNYSKFAKSKPPVIRVYSSQGKTVKYGFKMLGDEDYLAYVDRPNAPLEHYSYQKSLRCEKGGIEKIISRQLISKNRPDGRFQKIEYYNKKGEDYKVAKTTVNLTGSSPFLGRVKCLKAPVGPDDKPIVTHSFIYHGEEYKTVGPIHGEKKIGIGHTDVYDVYNRPTRYSYGWSHRLTSIEKIGEPKKTKSLFPVTKASVYSKDAFYWSSTNLKYRVFTGQGKVCF